MTSTNLLPEPAVSRRLQADAIVRRYALLSAGVGLVPVPGLDVAALGALHVALIRDLTEHYGHAFSEHAARNIVVAVAASIIPGSIGSAFGRRVLRALPFVTPGIGLAALALSSGAVSYALGAAFIHHYESGGTLGSFDPSRLHGWTSRQTA